MKYKAVGIFLIVPLTMIMVGCATGGSQTSQMIAGTYQIARKLDRDLGSTINRLNETAAALNARVEESDQQIRELRGLTEENQRRLEEIKTQVDTIQRVLYNQFGLSVQQPRATTSPPSSDIQPGTTIIEEQPTLATPGAATPSAVSAPGTLPGQTIPTVPSPPARDVNPVDLYQQAQRKLMNEDYEGAVQQFDEYVRLFPNTEYTANAQFWKAEALFRLAERKNDSSAYERAISEYGKLQSNFPTSTKIPVAIFNQAVAYERIGQADRAIELLKKLVKDFPATPAAERARTELQKRGVN